MTITRLIAYAPFGASLGPLPEPTDYAAGFVFNDVGALTLNYPVGANRSSLLGSPIEVAVEVSQDLGLTWSEPPDARFLYLRDGRDRVKWDAFAVECAGYAWMLSKALVPPTGLAADGQRTFTNATDGAILKALLDEAKARGWGSGFTYDFTAAVDSDGDAWGPAQTIGYEPGRNLLSILQEMAELGRVTWRMEGRTLRVFKDGGVQNTNPMNTVQASVNLAYGRDLTEAPFRRTWEGIAGSVFVVGDNGKTRERTNAQAVQPWGRWEAYASASGVDDNPTLDLIGDGVLETTEASRSEHTFGVVFRAAAWKPFQHYHVGHWINVLLDGSTAPESMRVRQVTLTRSADGEFGGNLVLNDRFLEADVLAARRIAALTGGASGGTGGTPTPPGADILAPAKVTGLNATTASYLDGSVPRAQVSLDWADVTTNADDTLATDIKDYETWFRTSSSGTWAFGTRTTVSNSSMSGFTPGQYLEFRVRARDQSNNEGAWSEPVTLNAASDQTIPPAPTVPVVTTRLATFKVAWDGGVNGGGAMPADFNTIRVSRRTSSGGANTVVGFNQAANEFIVDPAPAYDTDYWYVLEAGDRSGNWSAASPQAGPVRLAKTANTDIEVGAIRAEHLTADLVLATRLIAGAAAGNRVELAAAGLNAYGTGAGGPGTRNTFRVDAGTGNLTALGEIGTAPPGEVGIFLYSTTFSYAGQQQTRPVVQFNTGASRDQPSIQASTTEKGLNLYSGANTADRESALRIYPGSLLFWVESAADSGSIGTYADITDEWFRADTRLGGTIVVGLDVEMKTRNNRYNSTFEGVFQTKRTGVGTQGYMQAAFIGGTDNMQGMEVVLGEAFRLGTGGSSVQVVSGDGTNWRDVECRDALELSDRRVKTNLADPSTSALSVLRAAPTYEWEYENDDEDRHSNGVKRRRIGPMAQDLPPRLVAPLADRHGNAHLGVSLGQLLATAVQAIQELDAELDAAPWRARKPARKARTL
jgi:hypothetical protein